MLRLAVRSAQTEDVCGAVLGLVCVLLKSPTMRRLIFTALPQVEGLLPALLSLTLCTRSETAANAADVLVQFGRDGHVEHLVSQPTIEHTVAQLTGVGESDSDPVRSSAAWRLLDVLAAADLSRDLVRASVLEPLRSVRMAAEKGDVAAVVARLSIALTLSTTGGREVLLVVQTPSVARALATGLATETDARLVEAVFMVVARIASTAREASPEQGRLELLAVIEALVAQNHAMLAERARAEREFRLVSANAKQTEQALETAETALAESRRTHRVEVGSLEAQKDEESKGAEARITSLDERYRAELQTSHQRQLTIE